jgi:hypothetical protein
LSSVVAPLRFAWGFNVNHGACMDAAQAVIGVENR